MKQRVLKLSRGNHSSTRPWCGSFVGSILRFDDCVSGIWTRVTLVLCSASEYFACQGVHPCRTILLTTESSAEVGLDRATHHGDADRLEQAGADFHARVNAAFLNLAAENPARIRVVSSAGAKDETRVQFLAN